MAQDKLPLASRFVFQFKFKNRLDAGFRRNDGYKSQLLVDQSRAHRLGAKARSADWRANALNFDGVGKINGVGLRVTLR